MYKALLSNYQISADMCEMLTFGYEAWSYSLPLVSSYQHSDGSTMAAPWWHHGSTVAAPWRHRGSTMAAPWRHHG
jgi:hypothetical protein